LINISYALTVGTLCSILRGIKMIWKILAIVFIIVSIVEGAIIYWWWTAGTNYLENEMECSINVCKDADSFFYSVYDNICYCYIDNEIVKQEYLK